MTVESIHDELLSMIPAVSSNGLRIKRTAWPDFNDIVKVEEIVVGLEFLITMAEPITLTGNYAGFDYRLKLSNAADQASVSDLGEPGMVHFGNFESCLRKIIEWSY